MRLPPGDFACLFNATGSCCFVFIQFREVEASDLGGRQAPPAAASLGAGEGTEFQKEQVLTENGRKTVFGFQIFEKSEKNSFQMKTNGLQ